MGDPGEIQWLLDLIEEHPAPLAYDLRHRFGISIHDLGESVPVDESWWLVQELLTEPSTHLTAAVLGWDHPVSWEWVVQAQIADATVAAVAKKPKPYPRPWPAEGTKRTGKTNLPPDDAKRLLAQLAGR